MQEKQQAQQERVVELSERVADLQQKHRSLRSMLEAYQQVHPFPRGPHDKLSIPSSDAVTTVKLCPHPPCVYQYRVILAAQVQANVPETSPFCSRWRCRSVPGLAVC